MKLSPRMIQAMEILQLPMLALQERIDAELMSNPVLELHADGVDDEAPPATDDMPEDRGEHAMVVKDNNDQGEDFQRLAEFTDEYGMEFINSETPSRRRVDVGLSDRKMEAMANAPAHEQSLNEYLMDQWRFVETDKSIRLAGELIISAIDDDGYVRTTLEELAARSNGAATMPALHSALRLVQMLDPTGVGARDLKECLTIQLSVEAEAGADVSLELTLVRRFLRDIEMNRLPLIARRTDRTVEQVKAAIGNLSHLNPRPGALISARTAPVITPDAIVSLDDDGNVVVTMSDGNSPSLRISRAYRRLARDRSTDKEAKQFLRNNIRSAQWLVGAIQQRRHTVWRVIQEVFRVQRDFLEHGCEALHPLPMANVAERVGVHVATVSRAVAGKYIQTPIGIYPLRMFFSGGTTSATGQEVAWDAVKVRLKEIVDNEDKAKPLNDDELAAALQEHGLKIARRTVAKYRGLLNIPSARKRRQY